MTDSILLIHGDAETLRTTGSHLEHLGYDVTRELNGDAGLLTAERIRPGVVILHHALAGGPGFPGIAAYRAHLAGVVLLVPRGEDHARVALEAGAELTVEESASLPMLTAAIGRAAERMRLRRASETLMRMGMARHGTGWLAAMPRCGKSSGRWRSFRRPTGPRSCCRGSRVSARGTSRGCFMT